jgi:hypothetical protein
MKSKGHDREGRENRQRQGPSLEGSELRRSDFTQGRLLLLKPPATAAISSPVGAAKNNGKARSLKET